MGTTRYVYNKALYAVKTDGLKFNTFDLRNRFVTHKRAGVVNAEIKKWELETPKDIRTGGIADLVKGFEVAMENLSHGIIKKRFKMNYRIKKKDYTIVIPKTALNIRDKMLFLYPSYTKEGIRMCKDKTLKNLTFEHDCRLQYKHGEWYLIVPIDIKCDEEKREKTSMCALDPGGTTFQTTYSETETIKIQQNSEVLTSLHAKLDLFQSLRAKKLISSSHYTRRIRRLHKRLYSLIDELHFKTINYLTKNYNWILLPMFESQDMAMKGFNKKSNRNLIQLKHFTFRERLKSKCMLIRTTDVSIVTEDYTSKTCTRCGYVKYDLRNAKIYECNDCNLICERDVVGARNILLKHLKGS